MEKQIETEVLICGAGATGVTLAIALARRNVAFQIIENNESPFRGSRGKGIQPRTQEIFEDLGILDRIVSVGGTYPPQREYRADGSFEDSEFLDITDPTPAEPYHIPLMVPEFLTESVMRDRLAELGHRVEYGTELVSLTQDAGAVTARLKNGAGELTVRARYLVGADGGRSFVRHVLDVGFPGKTLGARGLVADVNLRGLSRDAWHRFNEGSMERQISLCPFGGTEMFQIQAPIPLAGDIDLSAEGLSAMVASRTRRQDIVVEKVFWASAFQMNARVAGRYRDGRVFLAGDAAHIHPPTGGQGLNASVQDAYNLGWKVAAVFKGAPPALLDTFEEVAAEVLGLSTRLLEAAKRGSTRRGREAHQLDIGYPESSLAMEKPERHRGVLAGDRAPDAPMRGASGRPARLFELFSGSHWTFLAITPSATPFRRALTCISTASVRGIGPRGDLIDDRGHFRDAYALEPGDWALVRPDGYIGAVVSSEHLNELESYLGRVGLRAEVSPT
jgi:2-polyprenyl-6-methoxyphenol hydroxylase-like FAD-dependent oxidoreductase